MGIGVKDLIPVRRKMKTATEGDIEIIGAAFLKLTGLDSDGVAYTARVMVYVSPQSKAFYLSRHALEQLRIIPSSFPQVGAAASVDGAAGVTSETAPCGCPARSPPPGRPDELPFPAIPENVEKMKAWLLKRYESSTFNKCPHQPLPAMTGPPLKVRIRDDATPTVTRRSPKTPTHWRDPVKAQLDQDVALGVIEKVPPGTPTTWLHNMVITPKGDGSPRRTIDLQPLNKVAVRETHHVIPPAQQVHTIPKNQLMTVLDAWNGYHSIPIAEEDRHMFAFNTEYGVYRCCRAPQGYVTSGDAYTHRYDMVTAPVQRLLKVVDDSLLYDDATDMATHWWRVIDYADLCGKNGIVLNPEKLQFSCNEVDFTSFHITGSTVTPRPKYIEAIDQFPRPANITDIRAWFGLVNQVAHYGRMLELMEPFKPLLSPKTKFAWSDELETAFIASKKAIVDAIKHGVDIFDPQRVTCLQTDFSGRGIGYWLRQKYCKCSHIDPSCCPEGWKITLVGSRFLRDAEKRYAAIEGECLAVAWALEDTRWFTLGCSTLIVATDHKPLIKVLDDKSLDTLQNQRLFRLKQKTLMWQFDIIYVPGKSNHAADAASRHPVSSEHPDTLTAVRVTGEPIDDMETEVVASARACAQQYGAISWDDMRHESGVDGTIQHLIRLIESGFSDSRESLPPEVAPFLQYRDRLSVVDGVVMFDNRMVVPAALRREVLQTLHGAHQGTVSMQNRAQSCVFWPGITGDISKTRASCSICASMAPSQPHMPPTEPIVPEFPFQAIVGDYFELAGTKFLVIVDRFTGWPHVVRAKFSTEAAGSRGLIRCLRQVFATFGAPDELSSDGGPEFTAADTEAFLKQWGVHHRISSAHDPQANGRAEVGVKSMKRLLSGNVGPDGSLDTDAVISGLLQYRNTPDSSTGMSPAMILFGRSIRDRIPIPPGTSVFQSPINPVWRRTWQAREEGLRIRFAKQVDAMRPHTKDLPPLPARAKVRMQNLSGHHPKRWDRSGSVVELLPFDQYLVRTHGSGRVVRRNRRHLRQVVTVSDAPRYPTTPPTVPPTLPGTSPSVTHADTPIPMTTQLPAPPANDLPATVSTAPGDSPADADEMPMPADTPAPNDTPLLVEPAPPSPSPSVGRSRRANAGKLPSKYDEFVVDMK